MGSSGLPPASGKSATSAAARATGHGPPTAAFHEAEELRKPNAEFAGPEAEVLSGPAVGAGGAAKREGPHPGGHGVVREGSQRREGGKRPNTVTETALGRDGAVFHGPKAVPCRAGQSQLGCGAAAEPLRAVDQGRGLLERRLANPTVTRLPPRPMSLPTKACHWPRRRRRRRSAASLWSFAMVQAARAKASRLPKALTRSAAHSRLSRV